tara:strand:- start:2000 stop:2833 length:834 start_codon:yes stop_codon:yes gene_type:complete
MDEIELAYAAGYIDGDGCFYIGEIKTSPYFQDTFSIISTHIDNIEWFKNRFDGSIQAKISRQKNRAPSYHFVFNKSGYESINDIYPFLIEKQNECKIFLNFRKPSMKDERLTLIKTMKILKNETYLIPHSLKDDIESIRNTIIPTLNDFAYLAGFIDAECSLDINRAMQKRGTTPTYRAQLQCNNTKSPFFYWASQRFGGQFHFLNKSHIKNCRNQMLWRISNLQIDPILQGIYPFLVHKKPICEQMIKLRKAVINKDFSSRKTIYEKVRHLNNLVI